MRFCRKNLSRALSLLLFTRYTHDRFVVLDKGHTVEEGPPRELLERPGSLFKALYDSMQTEER